MAKTFELLPEHRAQLHSWHRKWVSIAMRTEPQTDADRSAMIEAINGLYDAASLPKPRHIVFAPSPLAGQIAAGFAAAIWRLHDHPEAAKAAAQWHAAKAATMAATETATEAATEAATFAATEASWWNAMTAATRATTLAATLAATEASWWNAMTAATRAAQSDATVAATGNATVAAMWEATEAATRPAILALTMPAMLAATWEATEDATEDATMDAAVAVAVATTEDAWWAATMGAVSTVVVTTTRAATEAAAWDATQGATGNAWARRLANRLMPTAADGLCKCAVQAFDMCNAGSISAAGVAVISFFRHVAKLPLDYSKWHHYEKAAIHGGWRFMHPKFCIVVDFPERLLIDAQNRPHCADGPSHRWRDGYQIFHWHGLRIDPALEWIITDKAKITKHAILAEPNSELRRTMCEIVGWNNAIAMLGGKIVSRDKIHGQRRELLDIDLGNGETARLIRLANGTAEEDGTRRQFIEGVPPDVATPHDAEAWQYGISAQWYKEACRS